MEESSTDFGFEPNFDFLRHKFKEHNLANKNTDFHREDKSVS